MGKSLDHSSAIKTASAIGALAVALSLIAAATPALHHRYISYTEGPSHPYRASPLPDLPPLGERMGFEAKGQMISVIQIPPSTNSNAPNATDGWIIGTPEQIEEAGIDPKPSTRFRKPSLPFPGSTTVWHIDVKPSQPLADVTFHDDSGDPRYKIIKIHDLSNQPVADLYMQGNPIRIMIPLGAYHASMSLGRNWEGEETEFGPYGAYIDLGTISVSESAAKTTYRHSIVTSAKALP